ncbi:MAG: helix-turn-helix domain-containing protein [Acidimicrobiales bacterium]
MTATTGKTDRLLTVRQAADLLGTTERFPRRLIAQGRIDYVKLGDGRNGHVRIRESVLEAYIAAGTVKTSD